MEDASIQRGSVSTRILIGTTWMAFIVLSLLFSLNWTQWHIDRLANTLGLSGNPYAVAMLATGVMMCFIAIEVKIPVGPSHLKLMRDLALAVRTDADTGDHWKTTIIITIIVGIVVDQSMRML